MLSFSYLRLQSFLADSRNLTSKSLLLYTAVVGNMKLHFRKFVLANENANIIIIVNINNL